MTGDVCRCVFDVTRVIAYDVDYASKTEYGQRRENNICFNEVTKYCIEIKLDNINL